MERPFALVRTRDQWSRACHDGTAIDVDTDGVELARDQRELPATEFPEAAPSGGLAFDSGCRLYHSDPAEGRVERLLWGALDPSLSLADQPQALDFIAGAPAPSGDFVPATGPAAPLAMPRGVAVDEDDRLFIAEEGASRILVFDLWSSRLIRRLSVAPGRPLDLAGHGRTVWALLAGGPLVRLGARSGPVPIALRRTARVPAAAEPTRIAAAPDGSLYVLFVDAEGMGWIVPQRSGRALEVANAGDLEFLGPGLLVVARRPGEELAQLKLDGPIVVEGDPLKARGYDGGGIVRTPEGKIGFWTAAGFRTAVVARPRYVREGRVTTYRLDSGEYQTEWGRVFVDACVPGETELRLLFATADEVSDEPVLDRKPPPNLDGMIERTDLSPPMPPLTLAPAPTDPGVPLHRRETGRELAWARPDADDEFQTYEVPVLAPPGRYLWLTLALAGNGRLSPRVKGVRAEHPSHDLVRRLPRGFSRDDRVADFLRRYLAIFEGAFGELEARAETRSTLLDPHATPEELLPWLASFLGLTLDESWPERSKRQLIDEIPDLWRRRGTVGGLTRFLELYLGRKPILVEHFRLRGLGGALLTDEASSLYSGAIVGANLRVGGKVGTAGEGPLTGEETDAFETHAHRFSVLIPTFLDAERMAAVRHILDSQRPAHTVVDICTVATGMRVGLGLHVELLSVIGRTGGWETAVVGSSRLDRTSVLGRPDRGTHVGVDRLGEGLRVG